MKLHRFYIDDVELAQELTVTDPGLVKQWTKVLRFAPGRVVALFNSQRAEAHYAITGITRDQVWLTKQSDCPAIPVRPLSYLCFALLKKDKVNWVLQKGTELGVDVFVPLISERTEKLGFDAERARKIVIEAAEQSGRVDIPQLHELSDLPTVIDRLQAQSVFVTVAEQQTASSGKDPTMKQDQGRAVVVGPEGGWTDTEKSYFTEHGVQYTSLSHHTLRAETACIIAANWLQREIGTIT